MTQNLLVLRTFCIEIVFQRFAHSVTPLAALVLNSIPNTYHILLLDTNYYILIGVNR